MRWVTTIFWGLRRRLVRHLAGVAGMIVAVLGAVVGVSLVDAAQQQAIAEVEAMGVRNIVFRWTPAIDDADTANARGVANTGSGFHDDLLTLSRMQQATRAVAGVQWVAGSREHVVAIDGDKAGRFSRVVEASPAYARSLDLSIEMGRPISDLDMTSGRPVAMVGRDALVVFAGGVRVDDAVTIAGIRFPIVGVIGDRTAGDRQPQSTESRAAGGRFDLSRITLIPLGALRGVAGEQAPCDEIIVAFADEQHVTPGAASLRRWIESSDLAAGVEVIVPLELRARLQRSRAYMRLAVVLIAVVVLLVGTVGIANAMFLNVVERTQEIGLRRSVGATRSQIAVQFLAEGAALAWIGGALGGMGAVVTIATADRWLAMTPTMPWSMLAATLGVCIVVGIAAGVFPAIRAATMEPGQAIRIH